MRQKILILSAMVIMWLAGGCMVHAQDMRDGQNRQVGKVESDGTVRDASNRQIGRVESDGTVRDASNRYIGRVESDGTIRDASNRQIGRAQGISKQKAAVFFFFGLLR